MSADNAIRDSGIVRMGHHLGYGWKHGFLRGWPYLAQHLIVNPWNFLACRVLGHSYLIQEKQNGPVECTACMGVVKNYNPEHVIREWQIVEQDLSSPPVPAAKA